MINSEKSIQKVIYLLSTGLTVFLVWFIYFKQTGISDAAFVVYLPHVNALLNIITSILLITGFVLVKKGNKEAHIKVMLSAVVTSAFFLFSYLVYHHFHGDTKFVTQGLIRPVYFFILITHIVLSVLMLPAIMTTLYHAARKNWEKHRKIAKITFPVWLYVSVTGVLVYIFLQFFNQSA